MLLPDTQEQRAIKDVQSLTNALKAEHVLQPGQTVGHPRGSVWLAFVHQSICSWRSAGLGSSATCYAMMSSSWTRLGWTTMALLTSGSTRPLGMLVRSGSNNQRCQFYQCCERDTHRYHETNSTRLMWLR